MCQLEPGLLSVACVVTLVPFISQTSGVPPEVWNRMSDLPSPLKSPVAATLQVERGPPSVVIDVTETPCMVQISAAPVLVFWNRRSGLPSPLKSPVATADQDAPGDASVAALV